MKKFYCYARCSTCKKAEKWLLENQVQFDKQDLVADPPTKEELLAIFAKSDRPLRYFFNTSGQDYRKLNLKEKVPTMTKDEAAVGKNFNFLGVQWHPETLYQDHENSLKLFIH